MSRTNLGRFPNGTAALALLLVCAVLLAGAPRVNGAIITYSSRAAFDAAFPAANFEGWDTFAAGTQFPDGSTTNGITYNSSGPAAAVVDNNFFITSSPNGLGDRANPVGVGGFFGATQTMTFTFSQELFAFGIDINTFATTNGAYTATTNNGDVIGSFFNPFPSATTGQFVGFFSTVPFSSVTIAPITGFTYTLDSLRSVPTPEPTSLVVFGLAGACGLLGYARWRKRPQRPDLPPAG
jgi:hypothetical protein